MKYIRRFNEDSKSWEWWSNQKEWVEKKCIELFDEPYEKERVGIKTNYVINKDMSVDINGNVQLEDIGLDYLPFKFNRVSGYFSVSHNNLLNLSGFPKSIGLDIFIDGNKLSSLSGLPEEVNGNFWCSDNNLLNLEGCPKYIDGKFKFASNGIFDLSYFPKNFKDLDYDDNPIQYIFDLLLRSIRSEEKSSLHFGARLLNDQEIIIEAIEAYGAIKGNKIIWGRMKMLMEEIGSVLDKKNFDRLSSVGYEIIG